MIIRHFCRSLHTTLSRDAFEALIVSQHLFVNNFFRKEFFFLEIKPPVLFPLQFFPKYLQ